MATRKTVNDAPIDTLDVRMEELHVWILGETPLVCNRVSEKAKHELLIPRGRLNAADRQGTQKHDPFAEYRASPYILPDPLEATLLAVKASAFKGALLTASLDMPGTRKAQIGRLLRIEGEMVNIFGVPQLYMTIVRMADIGRTPDIRTRAILPTWACRLTIRYAAPLLTMQTVMNLLVSAGQTVGVGDGRVEKGKLDFGAFRVPNPLEEDPELLAVIKTGGRAAQEAAMESPVFYDIETEDLYAYWQAETGRRGTRPVKAASSNGQGAGAPHDLRVPAEVGA